MINDANEIHKYNIDNKISKKIKSIFPDDYPFNNIRLPADWEHQKSIWLSWPHNKETFEDFLPKVEETYIKIIRELLNVVNVELLLNYEIKDYWEEKYYNKYFKNFKKIKNEFSEEIKFPTGFYLRLWNITTADVWMRDYGPIFVLNNNNSNKDNKENKENNKLILQNWIFNAWGNKYEDLLVDNNIPLELSKLLKKRLFSLNFVLEGGSIDSNGSGILLTTEECLLNKNRNPEFNKQEIEQVLSLAFGLKKIIWLNKGIKGDDTDGHIDDIARWIDPNTILIASDHKNKYNFKILKENKNILEDVIINNPELNLQIIEVPMPDEVIIKDIQLPASYLNFLRVNNIILLPQFGVQQDDEIIKIFQELLPNTKIIGINCRELVYGLGTLHCISQNQPFI